MNVTPPPFLTATAPKLGEYTVDVLFGDLWTRAELSPRDRSLITVAALVASYRPGQLSAHLSLALDNGVREEELAELMTHLAFYAGWPAAVSGVEALAAVLDARAAEA